MPTETRQTTILGDSTDRQITLETTVGVLEPWLSTINRLVDECKVHFEQDSVSVHVVDPPNVGMIETELHPDELAGYDISGSDEHTVGLNVKRLWSILQDLKYSNEITLTVDGRMMYVRVRSQYNDPTADGEQMEVVRETELQTIDPDSVRMEPEPPDRAFEWVATLNPHAFHDTVYHVDAVTDYLEIREQDGHLVFSGEGDTDKAIADFGPIVDGIADEPEAGARSLFSLAYVKDMAKGIRDANAESVRVYWGDSWPAVFEFLRPEFSGEYLLAPRITGDGDESP